MQENIVSKERKEAWSKIAQRMVIKGPISVTTLSEMFLISPTGLVLIKEINIINPRLIIVYQSHISNGEMDIHLENVEKVIYVTGSKFLAAIEKDGENMKIDFVDLD